MNLFLVLEALFEERSATRAAVRLHVTQSAVSNSLARLRDIFGDPLFVRTRAGLVPTPRASELEPRLCSALSALEDLSNRRAFDLVHTTREWRIAFAEIHGPLLLPALMAAVRKKAPHATLRVLTVDQMQATDALASGEIDMHIGILGRQLPSWRSEPLFEDEYVCILRRGHPAARRKMTLDAFLSLPQVQAQVVPGRGREVDDALARLRKSRHVVLSVPYFNAVFHVVACGDCVATVPRRQAEHYAKILPLHITAHPVPLPQVQVFMTWHRRLDTDASSAALRGLVKEAPGK